MKEITDRLPDWRFDLLCARIKPGLSTAEKIGNVTVHRCGFGHPIDKYLLPLLGVMKANRLSRVSTDRPAAVWSLMASYGGFAALVYTWCHPRVKMLLTLQEGDPLEHYSKRTGWLTFLHKKIFVRADAVQVISRFLGNWAIQMGFRGTPEVIPNGVDFAKFSARISAPQRASIRHELGYTDADIVVVTSSRLSLKNAVDDLILSLLESPSQIKLLVAGIGEDEKKLKVLVARERLESRVRFVGNKTHDELPALLQASDIFCRPSLSESLGCSFLEAMAAGLPIIATPVGGIPDFLTDGQTGVFCQPRDPASIARAIDRLMKDDALRARCITQGEALVRERYEWNGIARDMDKLLTRLLV